MNKTIRIPVTIASVALLATLAVGCGDDDTAVDSAAIADRQQWCDVVEEVDGMFQTLDASEDEFSVKQVGYENISRLFEQLDDAKQIVDAEARPGVEHLIDMGELMTETMVAAESEEAAIEALFESEDSPFQENDELADAGSTWIYDNCGIRVDA